MRIRESKNVQPSGSLSCEGPWVAENRLTETRHKKQGKRQSLEDVIALLQRGKDGPVVSRHSRTAEH